MMLPNEILSARFSKNGKDGYRMSEVDSFKEQVYRSYNKIYTENNVLSGRVSELNALIQKYNSDKEAIASTLIYAQSTSDKTLSDARKKADEIVNEANERAEKEYADRIRSAEEKLLELQNDYERTKAELEKYSASYTENINKQAMEIIESANAKAAQIVAEAKTEAQKISDENSAVVSEAKKELKNLGNIIAKLKVDAFEVTTKINAMTEGVKEDFEALTGDFDFSDVSADSIAYDDVEPFMIPDFSDILSSLNTVDISSGRTDKDDSISGIPKLKAEDMNEYITKIFETVGSEGAEFSSFKEGLTEAFAKELSSSGDVSFASRENTGEDSIEE